MLATFVVNQTNDAPDFNLGDSIADSDSGTPGQQISLRCAIQNANLDAAVDNIHFGIAGAGVKLISPMSPLPTISQPVVIDGYTQMGAAPNTRAVGSDATLLIQLDGSSVGLAVSGLTLTGGNSTVRGLVITRFPHQGIYIFGPAGNNIVEGNYLGVSPSGTVDQGNMWDGIIIANSPNNRIGGDSPAARNVISGNNMSGVALGGAAAINNRILGNYIGSTASGLAALGNSEQGVIVAELTTGGGEAWQTVIGGALLGEGNLISGNLRNGVLIGGDSQSNVVAGNLIGTDANGTAAGVLPGMRRRPLPYR